MKRILTFVCYTLLFSIDVKAAIISGHVTGNTEKQIQIFYPFNGFTTVRVPQKKGIVNLDSSNQFRVQLTITHSTFITLYIDYNPVDLIVDDSSNLFVEIHLDSVRKEGHNNWLDIRGKYSQGNMYFNEYNFQPYSKYIRITDFFSDVHNFQLPYLKKSVDSLVDLEIRHFDSLLLKNIIDSTFWNIVSKNIRSLLYLEIIRHPIAYFEKTKKLSVSETASFLDWLFNKCNPYDPDLLYGLNTTLYIEEFFLIKEQRRERKGLHESIDDSVIKINQNEYALSRYYKHLFKVPDKTLRENLWANALYSNATLIKGMVTDGDIQVFKFYFPDSKWLPYLTVFLDKRSIEASRYESKNIHYLDKNSKSLRDVFNQFKGKNILIDIWATWCLPCRQEFAYNRLIDSVTNQRNMIRLYISIDNPSLKKVWESTIREYNLKGYHVIASTEMIKEMKTHFYVDHGPITIPKYVLVDTKGKIINVDAPRPSDPKLKDLLESF